MRTLKAAATLLFTVLCTCCLAQDRLTELKRTIWDYVQESKKKPSAIYLASSPEARLASEYVYYGGDLIDTFAMNPATEPRQILAEARRALLLAQSLDSNNKAAPLLLGNMVYKYEDKQEAEQWYRKALLIDFDYYDAHFNLGIIYSDTGLCDSAKLHLTWAAQLKPEQAIHGYPAIASCYENADMLDSALVYRKKSVAEEPQSGLAYAYYLLGMHYGKWRNDFPKSIYYLNMALGLDDNEVYYEDLSVAYGLSDRFKDAYDLLKQGIKRHPNYRPLYVNMAITCENMGLTTQVKKYQTIADKLIRKDK